MEENQMSHTSSSRSRRTIWVSSFNQPPGSHYWEQKGHEDSYKLTENRENGFTKGKICLPSPTMCCDEIDELCG